MCWAGNLNQGRIQLNCARGGYGRVYQGIQEATGESFAIKEMIVDEIFEREITLMNSLPDHVHTSYSFVLTCLDKYFTPCWILWVF